MSAARDWLRSSTDEVNKKHDFVTELLPSSNSAISAQSLNSPLPPPSTTMLRYLSILNEPAINLTKLVELADLVKQVLKLVRQGLCEIRACKQPLTPAQEQMLKDADYYVQVMSSDFNSLINDADETCSQGKELLKLKWQLEAVQAFAKAERTGSEEKLERLKLLMRMHERRVLHACNGGIAADLEKSENEGHEDGKESDRNNADNANKDDEGSAECNAIVGRCETDKNDNGKEEEILSSDELGTQKGSRKDMKLAIENARQLVQAKSQLERKIQQQMRTFDRDFETFIVKIEGTRLRIRRHFQRQIDDLCRLRHTSSAALSEHRRSRRYQRLWKVCWVTLLVWLGLAVAANLEQTLRLGMTGSYEDL